jgi:hypothetical protein
MFRKGFAGGATAFEGINQRSRSLRFGLCPIGRDVRFQVFELHLQLFDQSGAAFRTRPELFSPKLGDLQAEVPDLIVRRRDYGTRLHQRALGCNGPRLSGGKGSAQNSVL